MKTKNSFLIIVILIIGGLFSSGSVVSQNVSKYVIKNPQVKTAIKTIQKPSSSKVVEFKHPCFIKQLSGTLSAPHPDTIISYTTAAISMKEVYTYGSLATPLSYRRQYLWPSGWVNDFHVINTLDVNGNELTSLLKDWQNNSWVDSSLITNTYDADGNMLTNLLQDMDGGIWVNMNLGTFTYDVNGSILTELDQEWDGANWVNINFLTYTYDGTGNMLTSMGQNWNGASWDNMSMSTFTYDVTGNELTCLYQEWDGAVWGNSNLETWTFDASSNNLSYLYQYWDGAAWINGYTDIYTYDSSGNQLTWLEQGWQDPAWENSMLTTYTYDNNGNELTYLNQNWYGDGDWTNYSNGTFTYDESGNSVSRIWQLWRYANGWVNYKKVAYSYQNSMINGDGFGWNGGNWVAGEWYLNIGLNNAGNPLEFYSGLAYNAMAYYSTWPTSTRDLNNSLSSFLTVYPNPATNYLNLCPNLGQSENVCFKLYDFSGRIVANYNKGIVQPGGQTFTIYTGSLQAGEYILEMKAGNVIEKKKVTIIK